MIDKKTLFVIGAGAANPYGFPLGSELRQKIVNEFANRFLGRITDADVAEKEEFRKTAVDFVAEFKRSNELSIDAFINNYDGHDAFVRMGKMAIAVIIRDCELSSQFGEDRLERPNAKTDDCYTILYHRIKENLLGPGATGTEKLRFIVFNYDRALEHFLESSIAAGFPPEKGNDMVRNLRRAKFIHIYGSLGHLPGFGPEDRAVGYQNVYGSIPAMVRNINIMYEERANPQVTEAQQAVQWAEQIFLLGFGYDKRNIKALGMPQMLNDQQCIFGTGVGLETEEKWRCRDRIRGENLPNLRIRIEQGCDCSTLLRRFLDD